MYCSTLQYQWENSERAKFRFVWTRLWKLNRRISWRHRKMSKKGNIAMFYYSIELIISVEISEDATQKMTYKLAVIPLSEQTIRNKNKKLVIEMVLSYIFPCSGIGGSKGQVGNSGNDVEDQPDRRTKRSGTEQERGRENWFERLVFWRFQF